MTEPELYFNGKRVSEQEMQRLADLAQDAMNEESDRVKQECNVEQSTADAIVYLRSRSRWTLEKEQELIDRDHAGNPIPLSTVLTGDF